MFRFSLLWVALFLESRSPARPPVELRSADHVWITSATMKKQHTHVVIVGAGPGGLASAILLAKAGVQVAVVEHRHQVGGRTSTLEQDGFKFNTGPTFFLYPQVLREIFAAAGRSLDQEIPMLRLDP